MLTIPKPLIALIASFLNASNTIALRSTCKKFSFLPLNHFRLRLECASFLPAISFFAISFFATGKKEYNYICYTGYDHVNDLRNCEIRKLWLVNPSYKQFHSSTVVHSLVVDKAYWKFFDCKKISCYDPNSHNQKKIVDNKVYRECLIDKMIGYYNGRNLYMPDGSSFGFNSKTAEKKTITDFRKVTIREEMQYIDQRIKKLAIRNYIKADLTDLINLTHLYLYFVKELTEEIIVLFPPNLKVLKLNFLNHKNIGPLPNNLKKLKLKYCNPEIFNTIKLPPSVDWYKITTTVDQKKNHICNPQTENLNLTYICKYV